MGKIVQDGFHFVAYANSSLIRKIDDILELKHELITLSEAKTKLQLSHYALLLAKHVLDISGLERSGVIDDCFAIIKKWQNNEVKFQDALEVAGQLNTLAREEKDKVKSKAYRALGQIAATPHVRWHPLVASEYAVVVMNLLYPKDLKKVKAERELQIEFMKSV